MVRPSERWDLELERRRRHQNSRRRIYHPLSPYNPDGGLSMKPPQQEQTFHQILCPHRSPVQDPRTDDSFIQSTNSDFCLTDIRQQLTYGVGCRHHFGNQELEVWPERPLTVDGEAQIFHLRSYLNLLPAYIQTQVERRSPSTSVVMKPYGLRLGWGPLQAQLSYSPYHEQQALGGATSRITSILRLRPICRLRNTLYLSLEAWGTEAPRHPMIHKIGPNTEPCGTPRSAGHHSSPSFPVQSTHLSFRQARMTQMMQGGTEKFKDLRPRVWC